MSEIVIDVRGQQRGIGQTTTALFIARALKLLTADSVKLKSPFNEKHGGTIPHEEELTLRGLIVATHNLMDEKNEVVILDQYDQEKDRIARGLPSLNPCPFCGSAKYVTVQEISPNYGVICNQCKVDTGPFSTRKAAVEFWNERHGD